MDKESTIALQKIDCNCNDCIFMQRSADKFSESLDKHYKWQKDYFETIRNKILEKAKWWKDIKKEIDKHDALMKEVNGMKFQFDKKEAIIHYGYCEKLHKDISFIPNTIQLDTQECFKHRRG